MTKIRQLELEEKWKEIQMKILSLRKEPEIKGAILDRLNLALDCIGHAWADLIKGRK
jgi:hypothetical protein